MSTLIKLGIILVLLLGALSGLEVERTIVIFLVSFFCGAIWRHFRP